METVLEVCEFMSKAIEDFNDIEFDEYPVSTRLVDPSDVGEQHYVIDIMPELVNEMALHPSVPCRGLNHADGPEPPDFPFW